MRKNRTLGVAVLTLVALALVASAATAQTGTLFVKNNNVGVNTPDPARRLHLTENGAGAAFRFDTRGTAVTTDWYFQVNAVTGAFLLSNFFGGAAQLQVFPNVGGSNPPSTFVVRDGSIGFGTQSPGANILNVAPGKATIADAWTVRSSIRYKENVNTITDALEKVQQLRGVSFDWKNTGQPSIGLIAEEVGQTLPELVTYEANGEDASSLDYGKLTALLVEAVKAQQLQIEALQRELEER